jgi:23S rRNA (pseudouridine1915-N3)-methyltransferase
MQVVVIAVGRIKDRYLLDGIAEYEKRLRPYIRLRIEEIPEEKRPLSPSAAQEAAAKSDEGERIIAAIPSGSTAIALDVEGVQVSSPDLARRIHRLEVSGAGSIAFIIGGDLGLSPEVLGRCHQRISLSRMTFTHPMARRILLEQLYRACRINHGEPYHK